LTIIYRTITALAVLLGDLYLHIPPLARHSKSQHEGLPTLLIEHATGSHCGIIYVEEVGIWIVHGLVDGVSLGLRLGSSDGLADLSDGLSHGLGLGQLEGFTLRLFDGV
jgi:hypothetical protein